MAATSAHTKTYGSAQALAGNLIHNERAWSEDHPAPGYLLAPEHCDARGNQYIKTDLTPDRVIEEYLATNRYGRKHGRVHHKARPLRESVVVCKDTTGRQDVRRLMKSLESGLGIRCMYAHLHRDEGYISKKTGKPVLNYHIHVGYTNLVDGKLVHMDQEKMGRMQDICATALGMERGAPRKETKRRHLNPSEYRRMAREKDEAVIEVQGQLENEQKARRRVDDECNILDDENKTLRGEKVQLEGQINHMKATREAEVTTLARLKNDPDLDLGEGLDTIEDLATKLVEKNRELRQRLTDYKKGSPAIFHQLKELKTTDLPIPEKILAMTRFVDETVREDTPALPPTAAVEKPDRQEKSESESTPDSGTVDFDDIDLPEISEIRARKAYAKEQPPAQSPAPVPAPAPATPSLTEEVDIWLKQQAWERKRREAVEAERDQAQKALNQQQASFETLGQHNTKASADLKTLKRPKRYTQEDRAKWHAAKASELDDLEFDDTEKATPGESGQTENKEDHQDWKAEIQDKTKTPREKEEAGGELLTSPRQRAAAAEQERAAPAERENVTLTETLEKTTQDQARQDNTLPAGSNTTLQSDLNAERSAHRATKETLGSVQATTRTLNTNLIQAKDENTKLTNDVSTLTTAKLELTTEHKELKEAHDKLLELFKPLIKVWNKIIKAELDPVPFFTGIANLADSFAKKFLGKQRTIQPDQERDE